MKSILTLLFTVFLSPFIFGQIVINELDCDTPSIDDKEFVELLSEVPSYPLDGYVLVFFNGSSSGGEKSYMVIDLNGYSTDVNGLLLIGSSTVSPFPQLIIPPNVIQNGADAIAIYQASAEDFEEPTVAYVDNTLIDVLLYQTNDTDGLGLLAIFSEFDSEIQIINEGPANNTNSIQRFVNAEGDVYYESTIPTPRQLNDGSGIVLNGLLTYIEHEMYDEGDDILMTFTTEMPVTEDFTFQLNLNYGTFDTTDYTGNTLLTIPQGEQTVSTTISIIDDDLDEGDEIMRVAFEELPESYLLLNSNLYIRIVDNDFTVAAFGTPINPTYDVVSSTQPNGYYDSLDGLAGAELVQAIQAIIADPEVVRAQTYADVIDILKEADQNPENSNEVWLVYLEKGRPKLDYQVTSNSIGKWNREHTFPRSRGGFYSINLDNEADGKEIWWTTTADSLRHANSDAHALRVADGPENSSRGNQFYGQYNGPAGTLGKFKGDVARGVFFLALRYNGLSLVNGYPDGQPGVFGDLATLLNWHRNDPTDDFEMNRNNIIYTWQKNRNPFIDMPDLAEYVWGDHQGAVWNQSMSVSDPKALDFKIYPNPTRGTIQISGIKEKTTVEFFTPQGRLLSTHYLTSDKHFQVQFSSGVYMVKLSSEGQTITKKLIMH